MLQYDYLTNKNDDMWLNVYSKSIEEIDGTENFLLYFTISYTVQLTYRYNITT